MTIANGLINALAVDPQGYEYICGRADGSTFSTTPGLSHAPGTSSGDVFVQKLTPGGLQVVYSVLIGGTGLDSGAAIAVDAQGNVYVTGTTQSADFPSTISTRPSPSASSTNTDAFVFELDPNGNLLYAQLFGGNGATSGRAIAIAPSGVAIVGTTNATNFPVTANALQSAPGGGQDVFVLELGAGKTVQYATYMGGPGPDQGSSIGIDINGDIYVSGSAGSYFPTLATSFASQQIEGGFISKIDHLSGQLIYSSYLPGVPGAPVLQVDGSDDVYLTGLADTGFPATKGSFATDILEDGFGVQFLMKLDPQGNLLFATLVAGGALTSQIALLGKTVVVVGTSASTVFPATDFGLPACQLASYVEEEFTSSTMSLATFDQTGNFLTAATFGYCQDERVDAVAAGSSALFIADDYNLGGGSELFEIDLNGSNPVQVAHVVDAAGFQTGPPVPGQLITIVGTGLGPKAGASATPAGNTFPQVLAGVSVTVCGLPAPLLFVGDNQINAIVPTKITQGFCQLNVSAPGGFSAPFTSYTWFTAPSLFTANGSGVGQAAALNQDGSLNSRSNPAARGSVITLFGTGAGLTTPEFPDGAVVLQATQTPVGDFGASIGIEYTSILYLGAAPGLVNGVMQVNLTIPADTAPGLAVPVAVIGANLQSRAGVTIAIK